MTIEAPEETTCIVCGSRITLARSIRFRKDGLAIARCHTCGLMFRAVLPTEEELAGIYDASYFSSAAESASAQGYSDYIRDEEAHRATARRRLARLERFARRGQLLDVGAAAGFFVSEAARRGWDARGIDISAEMVDWGRRTLGVALEARSFAELETGDGAYDAITMWDYIEHAIDPPGDLAHAHLLLRPGGVLMLSTGDAGALVARLSGARWHLLTPRHHNYFFTAESLSLLLRRVGLEVLYSGHPGSWYSIGYLAYKLRTLFDVAPVRIVAARMVGSKPGRIQVPANLRDIVTVIARKPPTS